MDTYSLLPVAEQVRGVGLVSQNHLQRVASRLFGDGLFASVVVGNSELVKTQIERYIKVEMMGEIDPKTGSQSQIKSDPNRSQPQMKTKPAA
jgi:hypothetical protein